MNDLLVINECLRIKECPRLLLVRRLSRFGEGGFCLERHISAIAERNDQLRRRVVLALRYRRDREPDNHDWQQDLTPDPLTRTARLRWRRFSAHPGSFPSIPSCSPGPLA